MSQVKVILNGKELSTPAKNALAVPTKTLADGIIAEWQQNKKFTPSGTPLTALAYTAIDRIAGNHEAIVEALMVYVDTDTLSYRSSSSQKMIDRQKSDWEPVLGWASKEFGSIWQTVSGIEPAMQTPEMHAAIEKYLLTLDSMKLSAMCVLVSLYSSMVLGLAVMKKHLGAEHAFDLSRLEEEVQAEQWGRDIEADERVSRVKAEIESVGRFLRLLEAT